MYTLLLCLVLCADEPIEKKPAVAGMPEPIPIKVREYFERGDADKATMLVAMKKSLDRLQIELKSLPDASAVRKQLIRRRDRIEAEYRDTKSGAIKSWLPRKPLEGDIGQLEIGHLGYVLDGKTVVASVARTRLRSDWDSLVPQDYLSYAAITNWSKANPRRGDRIDETELFRVKKVAKDDQQILEGFTQHRLSIELERIPRGDVWKLRAQYDKEKKEKPAPALDPDEKPAAKPEDAKGKNPDNPRRPRSR